jgi:hypothetical protein
LCRTLELQARHRYAAFASRGARDVNGSGAVIPLHPDRFARLRHAQMLQQEIDSKRGS